MYETQVPLEFRALVNLGCVVTVDRDFAKMMAGRVSMGKSTSELEILEGGGSTVARMMTQYQPVQVLSL